MSTKPYNNFGVNDLASPPTRQPYVNSIVEFGYFSLNNTVGNWYSMNTNLITNNGLATTASVQTYTNGALSAQSVYALQIKNAGIYKITLSVFPALTNANGSGTISYNFGYVPQYNTAQTNAVNAFGGAGFTSTPGLGMYTYDKTYNQNIPGIISWLPTGYTGGTFTRFSATNELNYTYNYNSSGVFISPNYYIANGICTSEMTFFVTGQQNIFLNVCGTSVITMSNCYFTLELISTQYPT
jgi:hypothetical protein